MCPWWDTVHTQCHIVQRGAEGSCQLDRSCGGQWSRVTACWHVWEWCIVSPESWSWVPGNNHTATPFYQPLFHNRDQVATFNSKFPPCYVVRYVVREVFWLFQPKKSAVAAFSSNIWSWDCLSIVNHQFLEYRERWLNIRDHSREWLFYWLLHLVWLKFWESLCP